MAIVIFGNLLNVLQYHADLVCFNLEHSVVVLFPVSLSFGARLQKMCHSETKLWF